MTTRPGPRGNSSIRQGFVRAALLAMAHGTLLITNSRFPDELYIEPEDDYLPRHGDDILRTVDEAIRMPGSTRARISRRSAWWPSCR